MHPRFIAMMRKPGKNGLESRGATDNCLILSKYCTGEVTCYDAVADLFFVEHFSEYKWRDVVLSSGDMLQILTNPYKNSSYRSTIK